jgi:hypothetical protein
MIKFFLGQRWMESGIGNLGRKESEQEQKCVISNSIAPCELEMSFRQKPLGK